MLKVSPRKGVIQFGKRGKLNPQYIGPFKIFKWIGPVAYKLVLLEKLSNIHSTFHISNLKKCLSDESLVIPMKELRLDDKLNFLEEPVKIMDREVKQLKQSRIAIRTRIYVGVRRSNSCQLTSTSITTLGHQESLVTSLSLFFAAAKPHTPTSLSYNSSPPYSSPSLPKSSPYTLGPYSRNKPWPPRYSHAINRPRPSFTSITPQTLISLSNGVLTQPRKVK
ncbi:hypothetical protein Tco_0608861 [Tanacetum coccineum]